ncbi:MAG TPA: NAD-dependent epimerase/dehydratase family protein, partial [Bacteroidetes bacterium]|nr:NAD-dependent epimerase/dehydratase family protein [Bacteroidota bacterium]
MYSQAYHKTDLSKLNILITGGAGFIGSNICEYLIKQKVGKVKLVDNLSTGFYENIKEFNALPNFEFIEGDLTDFEFCKDICDGVDLVCHQAALGSVPRSIENPVATNHHNVTGFINIITAAKDAGIKRFVYASSSSVYGDELSSPKIEEKTGKLLSPYAVSKKTNEVYASVFNQLYEMDIIGLRYFNVFGPRQSPQGAYAAVIPLFVDGLINNKPVYIDGLGDQTRDFTFIENVV